MPAVATKKTNATTAADPIFRVDEVPDHLPPLWDVCEATVYRWLNVGLRGVKLRAVIAGGRRLVRKSALDEFVAAVEATYVATEN